MQLSVALRPGPMQVLQFVADPAQAEQFALHHWQSGTPTSL